MFFVFNLYAWRLSYTENLLSIIFCIIWLESPVGIFRGCAMSYFLLPPVFFFFFFFFFLPRVYFLLPQEFLFYRDLFLFCREHFSFAARFFLLPRLSFFCRRNFCFAVWFFLFPWPISFLLRAFFFCRGNFSFAGSLFLLLWHLRATADANAKINVFPNTPCTFLLFKASAFLQIFFLRKLKFWEHEFFSIAHVWHSFTY